MEKGAILKVAEKLSRELDAQGMIIIVQKKDDQGQIIGQFGLTHLQVRECLSLATYYNEKIELLEA